MSTKPDTETAQPATETLEEIAERIVAEWDREVYQDQALIDAIASALRNERERCATIAENEARDVLEDSPDDWERGFRHAAEKIAVAIREGKVNCNE